MDWWVTAPDRKPLGPVTTELLVRGIGSGKVPQDALVCEVGGTSWRSLADVAVFAAALMERNTSPDALADTDEQTTAEWRPTFSSRAPADTLRTLEQTGENTIVDIVPRQPPDVGD